MNNLYRRKLISNTSWVLSYKVQTNLIQATIQSSSRESSGESPNVIRSFNSSYYVLNIADFFPIPEMLLTESQPVIEWNTGSNLEMSVPNVLVMWWVYIYRLFWPTPVLNHSSEIDDKWVTYWYYCNISVWWRYGNSFCLVMYHHIFAIHKHLAISLFMITLQFKW